MAKGIHKRRWLVAVVICVGVFMMASALTRYLVVRTSQDDLNAGLILMAEEWLRTSESNPYTGDPYETGVDPSALAPPGIAAGQVELGVTVMAMDVMHFVAVAMCCFVVAVLSRGWLPAIIVAMVGAVSAGVSSAAIAAHGQYLLTMLRTYPMARAMGILEPRSALEVAVGVIPNSLAMFGILAGAAGMLLAVPVRRWWRGILHEAGLEPAVGVSAE